MEAVIMILLALEVVFHASGTLKWFLEHWFVFIMVFVVWLCTRNIWRDI